MADTILIVDDEQHIIDLARMYLELEGFSIASSTDGAEALKRILGEHPALVVLDLMLPGIGGKEVLGRLRRRRTRTPVLVLTARSGVDDKVGLLDQGADDYLVKPFDFRELEARCRALLRRPQGMAASAVEFGNLVFDNGAKRVSVDGATVELSAREFRLLELLLANLGRVLSKDALLDQLFGLDDAVAPNAVELYVSRLRRKLERSAVKIRTLRGLGYVTELVAPH